LNGASLVLAKPEGHKDISYLAELISQQNITVVHFVPPVLDTFLNILNNDYKHILKKVMYGGEASQYELKDRFYNQFEGVELYNQYGPTEATIFATYWRCESSSLLNIVPIGRPISNTQIYLLDANLNPVPVGVPGELHIAGKG
ncbi:AMP-binding protein, partial [Acinetobacter pittii]